MFFQKILQPNNLPQIQSLELLFIKIRARFPVPRTATYCFVLASQHIYFLSLKNGADKGNRNPTAQLGRLATHLVYTRNIGLTAYLASLLSALTKE